MNLYIFNETRRGTVYGIGTYIRELVIALKKSNINICVVNLISEKPQILMEEIAGIQYWYFPGPIPEPRTLDHHEQRQMYLHNIVYLLQLNIKNKKDLIFHLNFPQCGCLIEELKNTFECKVISVVHFSNWGFFIFDNLKRLRRILNNKQLSCFDQEVKKSIEEEKMNYLKVDNCICLSKYMSKILSFDYGIDKKNISIIPNGLTDVFDPSKDVNLLRKKWHIQSQDKIILFVGRVDDIKGVTYLIKAFRKILKSSKNVRLVIAGGGDFDKYFLEAKDICTKITFTGFLNKDELNELYRIANVGVIPSIFEPFGYVAVEMMIHELPIVLTATSGLNEVVDNTCGLKVSLTRLSDCVEVNTSILAQKILYLIQNPIEAKKMGKSGRIRYLKKYSSEIFGRNMINFYSSLL